MEPLNRGYVSSSDEESNRRQPDDNQTSLAEATDQDLVDEILSRDGILQQVFRQMDRQEVVAAVKSSYALTSMVVKAAETKTLKAALRKRLESNQSTRDANRLKKWIVNLAEKLQGDN